MVKKFKLVQTTDGEGYLVDCVNKVYQKVIRTRKGNDDKPRPAIKIGNSALYAVGEKIPFTDSEEKVVEEIKACRIEFPNMEELKTYTIYEDE